MPRFRRPTLERRQAERPAFEAAPIRSAPEPRGVNRCHHVGQLSSGVRRSGGVHGAAIGSRPRSGIMNRTDRVVPERAIGAARQHAAALLSTLALALWPTWCAAQPIDVRVDRRGDLVVVDVEATVAAASRRAWDVLTDYDHMASYLSMLKSSAIVRRDGNSLEVAQTGEAHRAFLHFTFSTLRAVELVPGKEIRSHLISGDFKSYAFTTRIAGDGAHTRISHHGEYVPNRWVPPGIGPALIKAETTKQYEELIAEMLRREHAAAATPAPDPAASVPPR